MPDGAFRMEEPNSPPGPPRKYRSRELRRFPVARAWMWYAEAMRLWKRGPATFAAIAFAVLVMSIVFEPIRYASFIAANVIAPLLATGLLYASLAADRGDRPRLAHLIAIVAARQPAQLAVLAAGWVIFAAEAYTAWSVAGLNLFLPLPDASALSAPALIAIYSAGVVVSLPVTFVPLIALFDDGSLTQAFEESARAFASNVGAMALYGALSAALIFVGLATMGVGLVLALPWIASASYAAWKDIFGYARDAPLP